MAGTALPPRGADSPLSSWVLPAVVAILCKATLDDLPQVVVQLSGAWWVIHQHTQEDLFDGFCVVEGARAVDAFVETNREARDVRAMVDVAAAPGLLGGHVLRAPQDRALLGQARHAAQRLGVGTGLLEGWRRFAPARAARA